MKIAILGFTKIQYMPYLHFYLDQIDCTKDKVHLIYWQRDTDLDAPLPDGVTGHAFAHAMSDALPLRKKLPGILGYGRFAQKVLRQIQPDFLILLHSTTALSIYPVLMRRYKKRYIFDYRDVTYETIRLYRRMVANVVQHSALSFTSSDGFRPFLPSCPHLLTSHNLLISSLQQRQTEAKPPHSPIRIAFWGLLRHIAVNRTLIEKLGGDTRFELHYYGRAQGKMRTLMEESTARYANVFFHGEYTAADLPAMAAQTDLVHNIYGDADRTASIAMGNKYYDSLIFAVPQLCMEGSLMADLCRQKGIGLACDPNEIDFADRLYAYYTNLDRPTFAACCDAELTRILAEMNHGQTTIKEVLNHA